MSAQERVRKLEELLARVKTRAAEPRTESAVFAAAGAPVAAEPVRTVSNTSIPPTNAFTAEEEAALADEYGDVEVSSEVVEIDVDVEEATTEDELAAAAAQQAASVPPPELEVVEEDEDTSEETPPPPRPANEVEEPAPSSSPRPIHEDRGPENVPRHTPPPESGKQVAASTPPQRVASAFPPPAARTPSLPPDVPVSEPPPSLEGHTLIGGWREPGLGPGSGSSPLGVRVPGAPPSGSVAAEKAGSGAQPFVGASPGAGASGDFTGPKPARSPTFAPPPSAEQGPQVTRPELAAGARVASFEGKAPSFAPATFGDLLDATLGL